MWLGPSRTDPYRSGTIRSLSLGREFYRFFKDLKKNPFLRFNREKVLNRHPQNPSKKDKSRRSTTVTLLPRHLLTLTSDSKKNDSPVVKEVSIVPCGHNGTNLRFNLRPLGKKDFFFTIITINVGSYLIALVDWKIHWNHGRD